MRCEVVLGLTHKIIKDTRTLYSFRVSDLHMWLQNFNFLFIWKSWTKRSLPSTSGLLPSRSQQLVLGPIRVFQVDGRDPIIRAIGCCFFGCAFRKLELEVALWHRMWASEAESSPLPHCTRHSTLNGWHCRRVQDQVMREEYGLVVLKFREPRLGCFLQTVGITAPAPRVNCQEGLYF